MIVTGALVFHKHSLFYIVFKNLLLTLYHKIMTFNDLYKKLLKTLWENEKMLVTTISSFSHNVFYPSQIKINFSVAFNLSSANAFNLDQSKILSFGKEFRLIKTRDCVVKTDFTIKVK